MEETVSLESSRTRQEERTSRELLALLAADEALRDCLDEETCEFWADCEFQDTLGFVYGQLLDQGRDPDHYLEGIGIFAPQEAGDSPS